MKIHKKLFSFVSIIVCLGVGAPVYTAVDKIGIWLFDEGIEGGVKDASGNGHDGFVSRGSPKVVVVAPENHLPHSAYSGVGWDCGALKFCIRRENMYESGHQRWALHPRQSVSQRW